MKRCTSEIQNWTATGQDGTIRRCNRVEGHTVDEATHDMHQWLRPGHAIKWPDRAALKKKEGVTGVAK